MFEKPKQHIRILRKLKSLRRAKNACPKNSEERKAHEYAYLHLRDRYLDTVLGAHDKGQSTKGAAKRYRRKFKHLGWGFVLRQVGMGMVTGIIRRPIQLIVTSILTFVGVKYFEPKFERPFQGQPNPIEIQTKKEQMQLLKNKIQHLEAEIELLKGLMKPVNDNKSQIAHNPEEKNKLSLNVCDDTSEEKQTVSKEQNSQEKFMPQQINKENAPDKKDMELKSVHVGITRIGKNLFVYKFYGHNGRVG